MNTQSWKDEDIRFDFLDETLSRRVAGLGRGGLI
jgi:hypothetical protein